MSEERFQMTLNPWDDVCKRADEFIQEGHTVFQQFQCGNCGMKQTMPDANKFFTRGRCEECDHITDIKKAGMNYLLIAGFGRFRAS